MRLGDLDALFCRFWGKADPFKEQTLVRPCVVWSDAATMAREAPTIDPETFPIVQELREELAREKRLCDNLQKDLAITANERDAALDRVRHYAGCWECKVREEGKCAMPFFKDECSDWEWRGPQKENERGTLDY